MKSTDLVKKRRQNVTYLYFASFPFSPPPTTTITITPTPPLGPLQPAACLWRSPLTSAARLGSVPALWALDGCGWSEKQSAVCGAHGTDSGRPAQTHQMTHKQPAGPLACLLHTPTNNRHTWRWVIRAATGPGSWTRPTEAKTTADAAADVSDNFDFWGSVRKLDVHWRMCNLLGWGWGYEGGCRARAAGAWHVGHTCRAAARLLFEPSVQRLRAHALQHEVIQHLRVQGEVGLHFLICQTWRTQGGEEGGGGHSQLHWVRNVEMNLGGANIGSSEGKQNGANVKGAQCSRPSPKTNADKRSPLPLSTQVPATFDIQASSLMFTVKPCLQG